MAEIIPPARSLKLPAHFARVLRELAKLPQDFTVRLSAELCEGRVAKPDSSPHFLLLLKNRYAALLQVQETRQEAVDQALKSDWIAQLNPDDMGAESRQVLQAFQFPEEIPASELSKLKRIIIYPFLASSSIEAVLSVQSKRQPELTHLSQKSLGEEEFEALLEQETNQLSQETVRAILSSFDPDLRVPTNLDRFQQRSAAFTEAILDLKQEKFIKAHLQLSSEATEVIYAQEASQVGQGSSDLRPAWLVRGVSGSGKSIVLIHKAARMARANPQAKILLLTHNRALQTDLRLRLDASGIPDSRRVQCMTFFQWIVSYMGRQKIAKRWKLDKVRQSLFLEENRIFPVTESEFEHELGFMKDFGLILREEYVEQVMHRRRRPLTEKKANEVFDLMKKFQERLKKMGLYSWEEVALQFRRQVQSGKISLTRYDAIFIDEAQFYAKVWFEVVRAALPGHGQLVLAGDHTQGFLRSSHSWSAAGLEVRGRTYKLEKSYRNSREVLEFAKRFFLARLNPDDPQDLDDNLPSEEELDACSLAGQAPKLALVSRGDMVVRAVNEVQALAKEGFPPGCLLLLSASFDLEKAFEQELKSRKAGISCCRAQDRNSLDGQDFVHTCLVEAATGLEAPVVILLGAERLFENEGSPSLSLEERQLLTRQNTKRFYMACTRAAQQLIVITESEKLHRQLQPFL